MSRSFWHFEDKGELETMARRQRAETWLSGLHPRVKTEHRPVDLPLWDSGRRMPVDPKNEAFVARTRGVTQTSKGFLGAVTPNPGMLHRHTQLARATRPRGSDDHVQPAWVVTV